LKPVVANGQQGQSKPLDPTALLLLFGDSISAGWGVASNEGLAPLMQRRLATQGSAFDCFYCEQAGVPGDTAAGGIRRIDPWLERSPVLVVIQFGGNDVFSGRSFDALHDDLILIAARFTAFGARTVIAGTSFRALPEAARKGLESTWRSAAADSNSLLLPDLLRGVSGIDECEQGDGVHPNALGYQRIADTLWLGVESELRHLVLRNDRGTT
jgi:acyl-CoA thioesterase-1